MASTTTPTTTDRELHRILLATQALLPAGMTASYAYFTNRQARGGSPVEWALTLAGDNEPTDFFLDEDDLLAAVARGDYR